MTPESDKRHTRATGSTAGAAPRDMADSSLTNQVTSVFHGDKANGRTVVSDPSSPYLPSGLAEVFTPASSPGPLGGGKLAASHGSGPDVMR